MCFGVQDGPFVAADSGTRKKNAGPVSLYLLRGGVWARWCGEDVPLRISIALLRVKCVTRVSPSPFPLPGKEGNVVPLWEKRRRETSAHLEEAGRVLRWRNPGVKGFPFCLSPRAANG
jgi:hypothetical protein